MIKFILRQSYKYILLIFVVLYMRYSAYYLNMILSETKRPMMEILKYNLEKNHKSYFINFFTFLIAYLGGSTFERKQNIIQYFYIPLNEIFLFLLSVIFISLGYKYKLRNDIIIIILIILIFIGKIFLYIFYVEGKKKYSTLYFYSYDYGAIMLNPIFNLPSFLIGMFFGLINYSIQKGINLYIYDSFYQRIFNIDNKDSHIEPKDSESENEQSIMKRKYSMVDSKNSLSVELNNYDGSSNTNRRQHDDLRSYSETIIPHKNTKKKIKSYNKNLDDNFTVKSDINGNEISLTSNEKLREMPFLILPTKFLNFYHKNEGRFYFKLIIIVFILLIALFSCIQFIYVGIYSNIEENDDSKALLEKLSFKKVINNRSLNFFYAIDIDLIVFMVNLVFFVIYSKGYQSVDIYNFFDNNFWSFFLKCYYSFIIISTPIILIIIYQSETVITFDLLNLILFSLISLFTILLVVVLFYSMF